jgi:hypothetical protein
MPYKCIGLLNYKLRYKNLKISADTKARITRTVVKKDKPDLSCISAALS